MPTDEDYVLLNVESEPRYENERPGTVTVEGFGFECWDYESLHGKNRSQTIMVSTADLPSVPAGKLLRRINELQHNQHKFGWHTEEEKADLEEFFGNTL